MLLKAKTTRLKLKPDSICPFCQTPIWGEGWNPRTQERFYSHVDQINDTCAYELTLDVNGNWSKAQKA